MILISTGKRNEGMRYPIEWTKKDVQESYTDRIGNKIPIHKESRG